MMDNTGAGKVLLANGRSPSRKSGDLVSRKEVEQFVEHFANAVLLPKVNEICQHYAQQIPELVARMLADALTVNGLTLQGPPQGSPADLAPSSDNVPTDTEGGE